jgi:hypothetical protein
MSSFQEGYALANDPVFQQRVTMALTKVSIDVMAEDRTTLHHDERTAYANQCLLQPEVHGMNMALGVATNPVITADSPDNDLEFVVISLFNAYAGAPN